jgi:hypothetical protein
MLGSIVKRFEWTPVRKALYKCSPFTNSALISQLKQDALRVFNRKRFLPHRRVVSIARSRTFREHQGKILLEGKRLICDALEAGAHPQMVFFSRVEKLCELPLDKLKRATLVKVKFEEIKIWSELVAPQGVMGTFSEINDVKGKQIKGAAQCLQLDIKVLLLSLFAAVLCMDVDFPSLKGHFCLTKVFPNQP